MRKNKINIFLLVTTILSISILLLSTTFSYFSLRNASELNALAVDAGELKLGLAVSELYNHGPIIPLKDELTDIAYKRKCLDDNQKSSCIAYTIEVFNYKDAQDVEGTIDFEIDKIENLSYMVFDESDNVYLNITHIDKDASNDLSLGKPFHLDKAVDGMSVSKKFTILIWLTDNGKLQDDTDSGGNFTANVTFSTSLSGRLTASISGSGSNGYEVSVLNEE